MINGIGSTDLEFESVYLTYLPAYLPTYLPAYLPTYLPTYLGCYATVSVTRIFFAKFQ